MRLQIFVLLQIELHGISLAERPPQFGMAHWLGYALDRQQNRHALSYITFFGLRHDEIGLLAGHCALRQTSDPLIWIKTLLRVQYLRNKGIHSESGKNAMAERVLTRGMSDPELLLSFHPITLA